MKEKIKKEKQELSLSPLSFEDALAALLEVKPQDKKELVKPKKKRKPTSKK